jgi:DNA polymerase alpha subunit A
MDQQRIGGFLSFDRTADLFGVRFGNSDRQRRCSGRANFAEKALASGRLLVDVKLSCREFVRLTTYEMTNLVKTQLDQDRIDVDSDMIPGMFEQSDTLLKLCDHVEQDSWYIMHLMMKLLVLPLSKQICNITGGLYARVFAGGRSERNEYLLCHEFHRKKYIVPDKKGWSPKKTDSGGPSAGGQGGDGDGDGDGDGGTKGVRRKKKPAYAGGLVLEPKRGFYDKYILLLDFNSLYPSIIQEYNLCFTTVERQHITVGGGESTGEQEDMMAEVPDASLERGVLPRLLRNIIEKRKAVKSLIKGEHDPAKLTDYDIRQKALKLTANSMYGCLGFTASRFYAKPIAALITAKGREILQKTVDITQDQLNLDVIYGDTDSIMVNTRCTDLAMTKKLGNEVKKAVNGLYKELELEIDGVFKTMLLLKKKKYAALTITERDGAIIIGRETKGLDIVRRDWCKLSHDVGSYVLNQILSRESREDLVEACHDYLRTVAVDVKEGGRIPLDKYIIHKGLTKDPKDYADKKHQPHVQVALRLIAAGKSVKALDTVPYVVCTDGTNNPATQRAYHPDDLRKKAELEVDVDYYLKNQIHPVVTRLLDPIDGTDSAQVASCLGLNAAEFQHIANEFDPSADIGMGMMSQMSDAERFKGADKLSIPCRKCNSSSEFGGVFKLAGEDVRCGLLCQNPSCANTFTVPYLCNTLTLAMRQQIDKYYASELKCDDEACSSSGKTTRQLSVLGTQCLDGYCRGTMRPVFSDAKLYSQLNYYSHLFDVEHALKQLPEPLQPVGERALTGHAATFNKVFEHIDKQLQKSARKHVDLGSIFTRLGLGKPNGQPAAKK